VFEVQIDNKEPENIRAHSIMIFNAAEISVGAVEIGPGVNPHDGKFDIAILRDTSPISFTASLFRLLTGRLKRNSEPEHIRAQEIRVASSGVPHIQVDGEITKLNSIHAKNISNAVRFMLLKKEK